MEKEKTSDEIISQALTMRLHERSRFVASIDDPEIRRHVTRILNDEKNLTQYLVNGAQSDKALSEVSVPGSKINRITINQLIGQGGMGSVYLGFDEKLKRQVAVKSIRPEYLQLQETHQRFIREAQILSKINHPSICHIYDYLETGHGDYLVLEYIEGKELYKTFLSDKEILDVMVDLAKALAAAHKHGIVHRDLKPDNIMITDEGQVKVLDFGIARYLNQPAVKQAEDRTDCVIDSGLTQQGSIVGTLRYMSPEQAHGEEITTASDIYSLGIIAQELLTREAAYPVLETEQLLVDVGHGRRVEPDHIPEPFRKLIDKLTQIKPEARLNAEQVVAEIERVKRAPVIKRNKRNRFLVFVTVLVLLLVLLWQWREYTSENNSAQQVKYYTESVRQLVKNAEQIYVLPIHNVKPEINQLLSEAATLFGKIDQDSLLTERDRFRLQGLIFLEAEEFQKAVEYLEKGRAGNYLLARAWVGLYIDEITEHAINYSTSAALEANEIRKNFLMPALKYINEANVDDPVLQAFKISQIESMHYAIEMLDKILQQQRWNKKAVELKAQILLVLAVKAIEGGQWDMGREYYLKTAEIYTQAVEMARSYPNNYMRLCEVNQLLMIDGVQRTGEGVEEFGQKAIHACENYLVTSPEDQEGINYVARIYLMLYQWHINTGTDGSQVLKRVRYWLQQSKKIEENVTTYWGEALIETAVALEKTNNGKDPEKHISHALSAYEKAEQARGAIDAYLIGDTLYAYLLMAEHQINQGIDIEPIVRKTGELFKRGMSKPSLTVNEKTPLVVNMGFVYFSQLEQNKDKGEDISQAGSELLSWYKMHRQGLTEEPNYLFNLANVHLLMAEYLYENESEVGNHLKKADQYMQQVHQINQRSYGVYLIKARIGSLKAVISDQNFAKADELFSQALEANPSSALVYQEWAESYLQRAYLSDSLSEKRNMLETALKYIQSALDINQLDKTSIKTQNRITAMIKQLNFK